MTFPDGKRVMHIDTSCKLYEKADTGIAYKIVKINDHRGLALSNKLKRKLDNELWAYEDYPRLYAICIYYIIREDLDKFDILVICGDEHFLSVKLYLDQLFIKSEKYLKKVVISISRLREITGDSRLKSYAHSACNLYRRKGLKTLRKKQRGIQLNQVDLHYSMIKDKWRELNKISKK